MGVSSSPFFYLFRRLAAGLLRPKPRHREFPDVRALPLLPQVRASLSCHGPPAGFAPTFPELYLGVLLLDEGGFSFCMRPPDQGITCIGVWGWIADQAFRTTCKTRKRASSFDTSAKLLASGQDSNLHFFLVSPIPWSRTTPVLRTPLQAHRPVAFRRRTS